MSPNQPFPTPCIQAMAPAHAIPPVHCETKIKRKGGICSGCLQEIYQKLRDFEAEPDNERLARFKEGKVEERTEKEEERRERYGVFPKKQGLEWALDVSDDDEPRDPLGIILGFRWELERKLKG